MARLAGLMGRGRGLEVILGADDFSADPAERYGYINRTLPDAEIEAYVDSFALRLASFEKHALVGAKAPMNEVTLPPEAVFLHAVGALRFYSSPGYTGARGLADQTWLVASV
jgi:enoyl-CoA hydratase/carnithine racemase